MDCSSQEQGINRLYGSKIMNTPTIGISEDYAVLSCKNIYFYYGYESSLCACGKHNCKEHEDLEKEWCFEAKFSDQVIIIPFSKLQIDDQFNCRDGLLKGIGWVFAKYSLSL